MNKTAVIGIVGAEDEAHCVHMRGVIESRGIETRIIDTNAFPEYTTFSLHDGQAMYQGRPLDDIDSFYVRSVFYSHPPYDLEQVREGRPLDLDGWYSDYTAERERQSLLTSWLRSLSLRGKKIVNPVESFDLHYLKPYQLALLRANGIPVPRTLVTNDPRELSSFKNEVNDIVYKPVAGGSSCREMEAKDWQEERLRLLRNAPVLFQEYIDGYNVRVYAIDKEIIGSGIIHTDEVDYRGNEKAIETISLPREISAMCITAMQLCGMRFSGIDIKMRANGEWILLECNPSPMFTVFESLTGVPVSDRLTDYLVTPQSAF